MISRRILVALVLPVPVLLVAFAVLMGGSALASAAGDAGAGRLLRWIAVASMILLVIDLVLLLVALGIRAVEERSEGE